MCQIPSLSTSLIQEGTHGHKEQEGASQILGEDSVVHNYQGWVSCVIAEANLRNMRPREG